MIYKFFGFGLLLANRTTRHNVHKHLRIVTSTSVYSFAISILFKGN